MRLCLIFLLMFALVGCATSPDRQNGSAMECHFDDSYALIAATDMRVFLELRSYDHDKVLESIVLSSRYMPPEFEAMDAGTRGPEFIVRTRDGGTGFAETHVALYGIIGQHIRRLGDFVVARSAHSGPEEPPQYDEELSGDVSFPKEDELVYRYKQVLTQDGKTATNSVVEFYSFDTKKAEYEKTSKP
jgi:hypothetical protein